MASALSRQVDCNRNCTDALAEKLCYFLIVESIGEYWLCYGFHVARVPYSCFNESTSDLSLFTCIRLYCLLVYKGCCYMQSHCIEVAFEVAL